MPYIATYDAISQLEDTMAEVNISTGRLCSEGFYINENTGLCVPECGVWEEFPHRFIVGINAVVILSGIVYFISGLVVLVLSCIRHKSM